jgi:hypothetical protein
MTSGQSTDDPAPDRDDWPDFDLSPTYNPTFLPRGVSIGPDEVVLYDPEDRRGGDRWVSASRDSHVDLPDCR